jgi:16S rRNA (cytidine1402-2'-O)-methyltransferase
METTPGTLWVVATPIGNLGDLSPRARATLAAADLVAAVDSVGSDSAAVLEHLREQGVPGRRSRR